MSVAEISHKQRNGDSASSLVHAAVKAIGFCRTTAAANPKAAGFVAKRHHARSENASVHPVTLFIVRRPGVFRHTKQNPHVPYDP